jgi:hypothetical protein
VFDIGSNCDQKPNKVAELADYRQDATRWPRVFGPGDDKRSTAIKYLAVVRE